MQSAHPCARKRPASAGGSTSRPPPLRVSATSSPPLPPPPPPPRLPARIAALSRALSVATKTGELPAEARHRITLTAPSTVMRRSVVGTVPGRKAVPAAPSPGRGRGGVDAGCDGPSSRPARSRRRMPNLEQSTSAASLGRISRPHLSATSLGHIWAASRTEAEVDALEGRVTKELPPPRLHRRRKPGRRSEECAQQAAEGRRCGAALSGREDGPRRRSAAGRAGRAIAFFFGGEGGVEPDCAHPRSVANHAHPSGGGHRVGAHRPAGREEEPPLSPLRLLLAPPLSRVPLECVSRRPEWGREWPRGRLWRLTRPTGGPSARQAPPPEARKARGVCGRVHVEGDIDPSHYSGSGASARVIRQSMAVPPLRPAPRPAGALLAPSSGGGEKKRERSCGEAQSTSSTRR